jgi:hypothetical protein
MVLLNHEIDHKPRLAQSMRARIRLYLDLARYKRVQSIPDGDNDYQGVVRNTGSAIDLINEVVRSERGIWFVDPNDVLTVLPYSLINPALSSTALFSDQPSDTFRYSAITEQTGTELLYNSIKITSVEEHPETIGAADHNSMTKYGTRELALTSPISALIYRQLLANNLRDTYGEPRTRFERVTFHPARLSLTDRKTLMGLDLGDVVAVKRTPVGSGSPATIQQDCIIIGVSDNADATTGDLETTFTLQWRG